MSEPIRVLHVVTHMNRGGLETMLMNYYRNIDRSQLQFDFLVHREKRAAYDDEIESLGGRIYRLPPLNPFSPHYRNRLQQFFFDHPEYRIVHSHIDCMSAIPLKAAKKAGVPVRIAHSHNSNQDRDAKYILKLLYKYRIPQYATKLMACSQAAGRWMFGGREFEVLNNAIDASSYQFDQKIRDTQRKALGIDLDSFVVGHVGRFSPQKNHDFLIDIFAELVKEREATLLLVGDGDLHNHIYTKVCQLGIEKRIIFTGVRNDVADLLQAMDVFVFPSHNEGLPLTVVEAQAAGLPCFISDGVPIECKLTNLVAQIPLRAEPREWAKKILDVSDTVRQNTYLEICDSGFDVQSNVKKLTAFYMERASRCEG